jgi:hypothetical protein
VPASAAHTRAGRPIILGSLAAFATFHLQVGLSHGWLLKHRSWIWLFERRGGRDCDCSEWCCESIDLFWGGLSCECEMQELCWFEMGIEIEEGICSNWKSHYILSRETGTFLKWIGHVNSFLSSEACRWKAVLKQGVARFRIVRKSGYTDEILPCLEGLEDVIRSAAAVVYKDEALLVWFSFLEIIGGTLYFADALGVLGTCTLVVGACWVYMVGIVGRYLCKSKRITWFPSISIVNQIGFLYFWCIPSYNFANPSSKMELNHVIYLDS